MRTLRLSLAQRPVLLAAMMALSAMPAAAQTVAEPPVTASPNGVGSAFELTFWQSVTGSEDAESYEAYLARYPDGTFSGLARARIAAIRRAAAVQPAAAVPPVPAAAPAPAAPAPAAPAPAPQPTPAVLTMPQAASPLAPTPASATLASAPAAPVAVAEAAPSPLARLLAQLRGSGDTGTQGATSPASAPQVTAAPPVQQLPANTSGLAAPAPTQQVYAPASAAPALALTPAASAADSYASARPLLLPVPEVLLPAYFCSTDARNTFHNNAYRPAVEVATRNNEAAVAYLRQLQQTYDRGQLGRDTAVLNAIAAEARAYQSEAARAYTIQASLVRQFDALMAVPLRNCAPVTQ